ncbi:flagellar biosynthesis anti-sigma factor FlgM [Clostridium estertheticum]|uniref:flagellar biosynthesis anti-sigma factor FlgM n=1 Tax=Clostridium estertheticum TaxID=238834 RepID=UPI001C7DB809|nr:flagellar biosynthesis anti-sigma factor FlgM [Clostridium estertheticum]MBX4262490.1 flagellar biosynthesis anti-sigma factor FlgM [Clostridium estertheticum]WLC68918.1 flagellar biosynthesis anti-sigma factor FlgM [Clostridium estertheticum]
MKIDGVKPNVVNFYKKNTVKAEMKVTKAPKDTIELSAAGKNLSALALDGKLVNSNEKIVDIKNKLNNGTYNVDSKLVAKKIIDNMKGRDI